MEKIKLTKDENIGFMAIKDKKDQNLDCHIK